MNPLERLIRKRSFKKFVVIAALTVVVWHTLPAWILGVIALICIFAVLDRL